MNSIFKNKGYIEVWESDLSKFVSEFYGRPWRMQQGEMLGQDTFHEYDVDDGDEVDGFCNMGDETPTVAKWLAEPYPCSIACIDKDHYSTVSSEPWLQKMHYEREHYLPVAIILNDLCRKGWIVTGHYLIKVWW